MSSAEQSMLKSTLELTGTPSLWEPTLASSAEQSTLKSTTLEQILPFPHTHSGSSIHA